MLNINRYVVIFFILSPHNLKLPQTPYSAFCFSPILSHFAECPNIISITCITFHHLRVPLPPEPSRRHMPTPILPSSDSLSANASPAYHRLQASPPVLRLKNFPIQRFRCLQIILIAEMYCLLTHLPRIFCPCLYYNEIRHKMLSIL